MKKFKLFNNQIEITINTLHEKLILERFFANHGKTYESIKIGGIYLYHIYDKSYNAIGYHVIKDNNEYDFIINNLIVKKQFIDQSYNIAGDLSINEVGEYSIIDRENYLRTSAKIDGKNVDILFPAFICRYECTTLTLNKAKPFFYINSNPAHAKILESRYDENNPNIYKYVIKYKFAEKRIMYELNLDNPLDSIVYEID
jgi:hypothetical protein